jgi:hypothetical protein
MIYISISIKVSTLYQYQVSIFTSLGGMFLARLCDSRMRVRSQKRHIPAWKPTAYNNSLSRDNQSQFGWLVFPSVTAAYLHSTKTSRHPRRDCLHIYSDMPNSSPSDSASIQHLFCQARRHGCPLRRRISSCKSDATLDPRGAYFGPTIMIHTVMSDSGSRVHFGLLQCW